MQRSQQSLDGGLTEVGDSEFLKALSLAMRDLTAELGVTPSAHVDLLFLSFLRLHSRFGLFSFGPVSIYVPAIEQIVARTAHDDDGSSFGRFVRRLREEQVRSGRPQIDELHALLAFMRTDEGLPPRVFGELGVTPEQVEEYVQSGGQSRGDLERLYSPEEAAAYLGIHVQTVRSWIRSGRLRAHRLAGQRALRIKASDLATVLEPVDAEQLAPEDG